MGKVSVYKCPDYEFEKVFASVEKAVNALGGIKKYVKPGMKVALKPNLVMRKRPEEAATTHPVIVSAVARLVRDAGGEAYIAESPGGPYTPSLLRWVYSSCGMIEVAEKAGIGINYDVSIVKKECQEAKYLKVLTVIKPLAEADIIINLSKLKTHGQMVYTGAAKNMFGAVPGALKAELHMRMADYDRFADALIDVHLCVRPGLNIMDAVVGMEGFGPTGGDPRHIGLVLAAENAFELDRVAVEIIRADYRHIPMMRRAVARGLCPENISDITVEGEKIEDVAVPDFRMPQLEKMKAITFFSGGILKFAAEYLKPSPEFVHSRCVGCGDCARSCPAGIITMKDKRPYADLNACIRCFCCQELCPAKAINIKRTPFARVMIGIGSAAITLGENLRDFICRIAGKKKNATSK